MQTVLGVCLEHICLLDTSAFSALEVLDDALYKFTYLLTYTIIWDALQIQDRAVLDLQRAPDHANLSSRRGIR